MNNVSTPSRGVVDALFNDSCPHKRFRSRRKGLCRRCTLALVAQAIEEARNHGYYIGCGDGSQQERRAMHHHLKERSHD